MLLTKKITVEQEQTVELNLPAYFAPKHGSWRVRVGEDTTITTAWPGGSIYTSRPEDGSSHNRALGNTLNEMPIGEEEFYRVFDLALAAIEKSVYPENATV